jgi:hypothetical protein
MLPITTILARRIRQSLNSIALVAILSIGGIAASPSPSSALSPMGSAALASQGKAATGDVVEIRAVARRGGVAVGPRGNAAAYRSRTVVRGAAVVRPGYRGGGAIAAGAAIGVVTAATAAAWAGAAPAPGMCWYYTDPSRTQGFWDYCQ